MTMRPPDLSCAMSGGGTWLDAAVTMMASNGACSAQPLVSIADFRRDIAVAQTFEVGAGQFAELWYDLDRVHLACEHGQDRRLVARSSAHLQDLIGLCQLQQLRHQRDDKAAEASIASISSTIRWRSTASCCAAEAVTSTALARTATNVRNDAVCGRHNITVRPSSSRARCGDGVKWRSE